MKLIQFWLLIILLFFSSCKLFAADINESNEQNDEKNFAVTIYPFTTLYALMASNSSQNEESSSMIYISLEIEYMINRYFSIPSEIRYINWSNDEEKFNILIAGPGLRFYPSGEGMNGFFIGHYLQFCFGYIMGVDNIRDINNAEYFGLPQNYISTTWLGYRWQYTDFHFELSLGILGYVPIAKNDESFSFVVPAGFGIGFGKTF